MTAAELRVIINDFRTKSEEVVNLEWLGKAEYKVVPYASGVHLHLRVYDYEVHHEVPYHFIARANIDILGCVFEEMVHTMKKKTHEIHNPSK